MENKEILNIESDLSNILTGNVEQVIVSGIQKMAFRVKFVDNKPVLVPGFRQEQKDCSGVLISTGAELRNDVLNDVSEIRRHLDESGNTDELVKISKPFRPGVTGYLGMEVFQDSNKVILFGGWATEKNQICRTNSSDFIQITFDKSGPIAEFVNLFAVDEVSNSSGNIRNGAIIFALIKHALPDANSFVRILNFSDAKNYQMSKQEIVEKISELPLRQICVPSKMIKFVR